MKNFCIFKNINGVNLYETRKLLCPTIQRNPAYSILFSGSLEKKRAVLLIEKKKLLKRNFISALCTFHVK